MFRLFRALIVAALAALALIAAPVSATAAEQDDGAVTWMVRPSDGVGEDGRSWVELELDPGQSVEEHLLVRNLGSTAVSFRLTAADGYFTDTGRFNMLPSDTPSVGAGTWIHMQDVVEVPAGGQAIVPFTVSVPENATPGDHPAGVAAAVRSTGTEMSLESRVGFRVMTRVTGEIAPGAVAQVSGEYGGSVNPFDAGRATVAYSVQNTGNTRLSILPRVEISALFGLVSYEVTGEEIGEIAPGETRSATVSFATVWPLFAYTAQVTAEAKAVGDTLPVGEISPVSAHEVFAAIPWSQLVTLAVAALLVWQLWSDRRRRDRRTAELVAQAREDGLAEARNEGAGDPLSPARSDKNEADALRARS